MYKSVSYSISTALRTSGHKHFVVAPISSIVGKDGKEFVTEEWTEDIKMQSVEVAIKKGSITSILSLFPFFKVEKDMPTVRILPALNTVEDQYKKMATKGRDISMCHQEIVAKYPSRLAVNENFKA